MVQLNKKSNPYKRKDNRFFAIMMIWPIAHFLLFYVYINLNSFLLAFQKYDYGAGAFTWNGWNNFREVFYELTHYPMLGIAFKNSAIAYVIGLLLTTPLTILFGFYMYKKLIGHRFFKFMLFLPSIISSIVVVIIFKYFVERFIPEIVFLLTDHRMDGLLANPQTSFATILFYNIWIGFGGNILFYIGAMNRIPAEIVEAGKVDGLTLFGEFIHITLPLIYPTLTTIITCGVVGLFTNQLNLFTFFGTTADYNIQTIGYYLFGNTLKSDETMYPFLSACGMLLTIIVAPITFLVKFLMERFGPADVAF